MKKINIIELLFYISYTLLVIYHLCGQVTFIIPIRKNIYTVIPFLLTIILIFQSKKYSVKSIIIITILTFLFYISKNISHDNNLFITMLFIIASKNINIKKFIKYDLKIKIIISSLIIFLYNIGLAENVIRYRLDGTIRNSLGFGHPNVLGAIIFSIIVDIICLKYKKLKIKDYIFILTLFILSTIACDSRAAQLGTIILIVLSMIFPYIENKKNIINWATIIPFVLFFLTYTLVVLYPKNIQLINNINEIFSSRIRLAYEFYDYYGINLFGHFFLQKETWKEQYYLYVLDISYMTILIKFGIIALMSTLISFSLSIKKAINNSDYGIAIAIISIMFYGLMENYAYMIGYNAILVYISYLIYERKEKKYEKNSNNNISLII